MAGNFRGHTFNAMMQPRAVDDRPLTFRGAIAPLGTYANPDGTEEVGLAWPGMITEPLNALQRLHENSYTEDGRPGIPNPQDPENLQDASTLLWSIYGGNALNPIRSGARTANTIERSVTKYDMPMYQVTDPGGNQIARAAFDELPNAVRVRDLMVNPEHRGKGIASQMYGHIQDDIGKPMTPDFTLSQDGYSFWKKHYPEAVRDYEFTDDGFGAFWRQPGNLDAESSVPEWRMSGGPNRPDGVLWSDTGKPSIAGAAIAGENARPGITAYHGSPHDFEKFDLSKIGTGEGAQAFGHGLYFAENEGVAKTYRDQLSGQPYGLGNAGHMYQVRINGDPSDFFDYDATVGMQSPSVREVLNRLGVADDNLQGASALTALGAKNNWRKRLQGPSGLLKEAGIPGIKYLDQTSRTAGEGTRNYVVFDDSLIEILKKYGLAGGAIGASSLFDFNTENQF